MHIVIPMSGVGKRFVDAGYTDPKPLIEVDGMPIIEHVCNLFPLESKFTFICNSTHLRETKMREVLSSLKPNANIVEIPNHKKGPVFAVSHIFDLIDDEEEVIVNYCDFGTYWDYNEFLNHTRNRNADGAVVAYRGFHPHMLGPTNYAFLKSCNQWMEEIKEKEPFTNNRLEEYASNGTYYFKKGGYIKKYFNLLMESEFSLNGEFYVSLVYNLLAKDGLKVSIFEIQHMLQWGTPSDLKEYIYWSEYFEKISSHYQNDNKLNGTLVLPLAGNGSRFKKEGYLSPKPLLPISGKPMVVQAVNSLPKFDKISFICLQDHCESYSIDSLLTSEFKNSSTIKLSEIANGQAVTCSKAIDKLNLNEPFTISASDNSVLYDFIEYKKLLDKNPDIIVWTFQNHMSSNNNPQMYGWVKTDGLKITKVSVKEPISNNPVLDFAIVGTFYFKNKLIFDELYEELLCANLTVNNEFYVDSLIGLAIKKGLKVLNFKVEKYISWGTPNDYETYIYWQKYFHKTPYHPYSIYLDRSVNASNNDFLESIDYTLKQVHI